MIKVYCKKHPKYKGKSQPRESKKYPGGCIDCWAIWGICGHERTVIGSNLRIK